MSSISKALQRARGKARLGEKAPSDKPAVVSSDANARAAGPVDIAPKPPPREDIRKAIQPARFKASDEHLVTLHDPESAESEHYQTLRFSVERMHRRGEATVIGLSSGSPKDGKTLTTLNLAGSIAQNSKSRVLVIDADLRNPSVGRYLGLASSSPGVSGALRQTQPSLEALARLHPDFNLAVLASTAPDTAPYEVFKSPEVQSIFEQARTHFDYVLVDMPPLVFPEIQVVNELLDGLLVVISAHITQRPDLVRGLESIDGSKVKGIVFNRDSEQRKRIPAYYHYRRA